ncbi:MAG: response regulator [Myxococcaceae bacterium]|nr:response regulator [Myxococcaceae bacterium]
MPLVLIVDDEADLAGLVEFNLRAAGLETTIAGSGEAALKLAQQRKPDLVLLDLMLPDISGKEVCRRFRADPKLEGVPVVMLTARGDEPDRVEGFLAGADDYVTKPFSVRELVLRVQAVLKRGGRPQGAQVLRTGPFELDLAAHRFFVEKREIELTVLEFKLVQDLMAHPGQVRTREKLLSEVWGITSTQETRTVDTHVMRLREKLGVGRDKLETVRGIGYRLLDS